MKRVIALVMLFALSACGGPPRLAQQITTSAARGLDAVDRAAALRYTAAAESALASAVGWEDYDRRMAGWDELERWLRVTHGTLLAAQALLDSWEQGSEERWLALAACLVGALTSLADAAMGVGLEIPPEITSALHLGEQFAGPVCR